MKKQDTQQGEEDKKPIQLSITELLKRISNTQETPKHILNIGYEIETGLKRSCERYKYEVNEFGDRKATINTSKDYKEFEKYVKDKKFNLNSDGSIHTNSYAMELNSRVYTDIKTKEDLKVILEDIKPLFSFIEDCNNSMGLHFHISFKSLVDYYTLLDYEFFKLFVEKYKTKFTDSKEQYRLNNGFCKSSIEEKEFNKITRLQLKSYCKNARYTAINYNSFNIHKTIEFRIFPSVNNLKKFEDYLYFLYDTIIKYLKEEGEDNTDGVYINKKSKKEDNKLLNSKEVLNLNEFEVLKGIDITGVF